MKHSADYDVVVVGGALAGASSALLLKREVPGSRILMVERSDRFPHKVGEATVELSAHFLLHRLGLEEHLAADHLPKQGLRFWFTDGKDRSLDQLSETGPHSSPVTPSFQLDRSKLDQQLFELASSEGVEVVRPGKVRSIEQGWPITRLEIEDPAGSLRAVTTRWVVDASGRAAFLARRFGLLKRTERHPIAATWARWEGVVDLDSAAQSQPVPLPQLDVSRRLATNHFCGDGWWCWVIPLACGKTSIGWVYNKEMCPQEGEGSANDRYLRFVRAQPGLRELVSQARPCDGDIHSYRHLPYRTRQYADRGWALVGDAASLLDPYYSPGLDHAAISVHATAELIKGDLDGETDNSELEQRIRTHNSRFALSYERWLDALYTGKYSLLGDAELTSCAFLVETAFYFIAVVTPVFKNLDAFRNPVFGIDLPQATLAYWLARSFNRRLQKLARRRRRSGHFGRKNVGWRVYIGPFRLGLGSTPILMRGLALWAKMEMQQAFWSLMPRRRRPAASDGSTALARPAPPP